jgi:hypothetical protein
MPKARYSPKVKAKFIAAASAARSAGKPWAVAFSAAREAGYKGSLQGITKLLRDAGKTGKAAGKAAGKRRGRKPGRKPMAVVTRGSGRPLNVNTETGGIEALVAKVVKDRVGAILEKAIAMLEQAKGE